MVVEVEMSMREGKLASNCQLSVCYHLLGSTFLKLFSIETIAQLVMVGDGLFEQGIVPLKPVVVSGHSPPGWYIQ